MPVFESDLNGELVAEGNFGSMRVANNISIWLPGVLKVDPWPQEGMIRFEWYVPADEGTHHSSRRSAAAWRATRSVPSSRASSRKNGSSWP